jgi:hypothetical protein
MIWSESLLDFQGWFPPALFVVRSYNLRDGFSG